METLQPERKLSHAPLFQTMLVWANAPAERLELGGLEVEAVEAESGTARFDLTLEMGEGVGGELWGSLEYASDLWDESTVARMAGHFCELLGQMAGKVERPVTELELAVPEQAQWNATGAEYPRGVTIHALVEEQAARDPERAALRFEGQALSYGELVARAKEMSREMGPRQLVAISLERGFAQVVAQMGALEAGGAYVPVDPSYPEERREYMLADSGAGVVVNGEGILKRGAGREVDGLAYMIYTSGSTGRPKGTMLRHEGLCNLARWQQRAFGITRESRVLQFAPSSFDASVWETFMALANGATLVLGRQEVLGSMEALYGLLKQERVTHVTLPPTVLGALEAEGLPDLQVVIAAGEACGRELVEKWGKGRRFFNAYGPTETTVCASAYECKVGEGVAPAIGRPIANMQMWVLDKWGRPAPVGVSGELHIGGVGLAAGYWERPELTAEKFVETAYGRVYKSGDVGRWRGDGVVEYVGRRDTQVKLRGYRIELGEVEEALRSCVGVKATAVGVDGDRLVGYVVGGDVWR